MLIKRADKIKLLLTDVDGVLTDNGVYYSEKGEELKRFSIRDGMGVERLRKIGGIDTGIITGEQSPSVIRRAEKLKITELHLGVSDKLSCLLGIKKRLQLEFEEIAFIGDDVNDLAVIEQVGITACPFDAMIDVVEKVNYKCETRGGHGAFREFAELLIAARKNYLQQ